MYDKEPAIPITPLQAMEITKTQSTAKEWYYVKSVFKEWRSHLTAEDLQEPDFSFYNLLATCFTAGRIYGETRQGEQKVDKSI